MSKLTPTIGHKVRTAPGGRQETWTVPDTLEVQSLFKDLPGKFSFNQEKGMTCTRKWFDTDDWRLYRKNLLLGYEDETWKLMQVDSGRILASLSARKSDQIRFASDFPVSQIRSLIEPVISVRSLLNILSHDLFTSCFRILNADNKTIALLYHDKYVAGGSGSVHCSLILKGFRGYDASFKELHEFCASSGLMEKAAYSAPVDQGIKSLGRSPLDYSSKFSIRLKPDMPARAAMDKIYLQLLETMEHNVQGVIDDLDTEFLHDFRVALRRTRSGLSQVKGVLPPEVLVKAKKDFSWLGSVTGPTRDLDVYLLEQEQYLSRLPRNLRRYLTDFFVDISKRREVEQRKLVRNFQSVKFKNILKSWHGYLVGMGAYGETELSGKPVKSLAQEIIFRKYRKILKDGGKIKRSSPDEDLHSLRIHCKKLRYILEFFTSLFPKGKIKMAVKQLKRLQDNLGSFNDLSVQQDMLQEYLGRLKPGTKKNQQLATAIGGLLTNLHHEQQGVRKEFYSRFHQFSCEENLELYTKLFN